MQNRVSRLIDIFYAVNYGVYGSYYMSTNDTHGLTDLMRQHPEVIGATLLFFAVFILIYNFLAARPLPFTLFLFTVTPSLFALASLWTLNFTRSSDAIEPVGLLSSTLLAVSLLGIAFVVKEESI